MTDLYEDTLRFAAKAEQVVRQIAADARGVAQHQASELGREQFVLGWISGALVDATEERLKLQGRCPGDERRNASAEVQTTLQAAVDAAEKHRQTELDRAQYVTCWLQGRLMAATRNCMGLRGEDPSTAV